MRISDLYDLVIAETGQFLIPKNKLELQEEIFTPLINPILGIINQYSPIDYHFPLSLNATRYFSFTEESTPYGIPEFITDTIPYGNLEQINVTLFGKTQSEMGNAKMYRPYIYRKPMLIVSASADYDVHGVFHHKMVSRIVENNTVYFIDTLDTTNHNLVRLAAGKFLKALGRSRRAFTLSDLPITNDASDMVSEGETMEEKAIEDLRENHHKFYLAYS